MKNPSGSYGAPGLRQPGRVVAEVRRLVVGDARVGVVDVGVVVPVRQHRRAEPADVGVGGLRGAGREGRGVLHGGERVAVHERRVARVDVADLAAQGVDGDPRFEKARGPGGLDLREQVVHPGRGEGLVGDVRGGPEGLAGERPVGAGVALVDRDRGAARVGEHGVAVAAAGSGVRRRRRHVVQQPGQLAVEGPRGPGPRAGEQQDRSVGVLLPAERLERRPELGVGVGRPVLPGLDHLRGGRDRPLQVHRLERGRGRGLEVERRDDAEVPAAPAAQRPEQVGLLLRARRADGSVGGDHLHRGDRVAGQPHGRGSARRPHRRASARRYRRWRTTRRRSPVPGRSGRRTPGPGRRRRRPWRCVPVVVTPFIGRQSITRRRGSAAARPARVAVAT